jgi:cytochrome d ubiquinol oxidase subunit II
MQGVSSPHFVKDSPLVVSEKGINLDQTGHFIGTTWEGYIWQSLLVALTLIKGYILIDPTYVVYKTEG